MPELYVLKYDFVFIDQIVDPRCQGTISRWYEKGRKFHVDRACSSYKGLNYLVCQPEPDPDAEYNSYFCVSVELFNFIAEKI